jgi:hypothetical protein
LLHAGLDCYDTVAWDLQLENPARTGNSDGNFPVGISAVRPDMERKPKPTAVAQSHTGTSPPETSISEIFRC